MDISQVHRYALIGRNDQHWYKLCEENFVTLFGRERLELVCKLFAATSINTSLKANITLFRKALHEIETGKPVGNYLPNIRNQIELVRAGTTSQQGCKFIFRFIKINLDVTQIRMYICVNKTKSNEIQKR